MLQATRRALINLGLLGILCRALVPVGLMPAPVSAGGPLVFCHGGAAGAFFRALAAHGGEDGSALSVQPAHAEHGGGHAHQAHPAPSNASHAFAHAAHAYAEHAAGTQAEQVAPSVSRGGSDDAADEHLGWELCSFATAFAQAALAPSFDMPLLELAHARVLAAPRSHPAAVVARPYWARGPPSEST